MPRKKMAPGGMVGKMTFTMSQAEVDELEAEAKRLTELDLDGFGRTISKSDVLRRWVNAGKKALAEVESETKKKR